MNLNNNFFYLWFLLCVGIDITCFSILHTPLVHTVVCLYITTLLWDRPTGLRISLLWIALSASAFMLSDHSLSVLIPMLSTMVVAKLLRSSFYPTIHQAVLLLVLYVMLTTFVTMYVLKLPVNWLYTKQILAVNIVVVMFFSLIVSRGRQGNRFLKYS